MPEGDGTSFVCPYMFVASRGLFWMSNRMSFGARQTHFSPFAMESFLVMSMRL
jgi:hypothetical protein